ncbi:hypothetical protein CDO52_15725 [Nocardiopsis gilva YIM 90087]|uniref:Uncharacterized protein n=2 Tax=Nocardiopsis gilva TaxID=280236 RepID=A0A223S7E1_9ACTN|nr:hypothetical protein [Nocardiopsis gilva]ASU84045.1 hypothetical protein CDO52_15725 [Nocardiopsis gilva YIM 90087]
MFAASLRAASDTASGDALPRNPTPQEEEALAKAEQLLLKECMEDKGFEYWIAIEEPQPETKDHRYVIDDPDWAEKHGYGSELQRERAELREKDPNRVYFESLPEERRADALRAANGPQPVGLRATTPDGMSLDRSDQGCTSQAQRELYGDLPAWFQARVTVDSLPEIRYQRVIGDPRYKEAAKPWAACMSAAGHEYATPLELRDALPPPEAPMPKEDEVDLATAEARCAVESGFADVVADLDSHYAGELRREYASALAEKRRLQLDALPRAYSVIGENAEEAPGGGE